MKSRWSESKAKEQVNRLAETGVDEQLALRVYTTRLLGQDPKLVLHGGGNTSLKAQDCDVLGDQHDVIRIKGSGWDMANIEAEGLPAVKIEPLLKLRCLTTLSDEDMVNFERSNLIDGSAPTPSIETLLHAFLPHSFVDHTHSTDVLSLTNQSNGDELCREVFGDRAGIVPYIKPGFDLAKMAATVFEAGPDVEALILLKHGIFTFAETAQQAYERMIEMVTLVEDRLKTGRRRVFGKVALPEPLSTVAEVAPVVRGACSLHDGNGFDGIWRFILDFRTGPTILNYVNGKNLRRYSQAGVATPDHTIRTKNWPMVLPAPARGEPGEFKRAVIEAVDEYCPRYQAYFQRHN